MNFSSHVINALDMVDRLIVGYGGKRICLDQFLDEMEKKCGCILPPLRPLLVIAGINIDHFLLPH